MKVSVGTGFDAARAEEVALMARVAAGDSGEPMAALYQRYGSPLYGLGLRLLGDRGMAEEMVQETFVRLWRGAGRFDSEKGSVRTLIYTIARRTAVDLHRRTASRPLTTQEGANAGLEGLGDDEFDKLLVGLDVRAALTALSPKHREILELHFEADLTQTQVAEQLGVPLGTVKTRTYYGLKALRLELEERGLVA